MSQLSIIVATAKNRVIGLNNNLPWHLPEDLKRFKALTMGHHIIMGRKTFESLGRLLPGRKTVIVTRNKGYRVEGATVTHSLQDALESCKNDSEVFLIGGAEMYQQSLKLANKLYITEINATFAGDAYLPEIDLNIWQEIVREPHISEKGLGFTYVTYVRVES